MKVTIGVSASRFPQGASVKRQSFAPITAYYTHIEVFTEHMTYEYSLKIINFGRTSTFYYVPQIKSFNQIMHSLSQFQIFEALKMQHSLLVQCLGVYFT